MIALLIVSITLAAAAPMLSKRNKAITSGNSKWMFTSNGSDITRTRGKVGIGVPTNTNPTALLDIRSSAVNTDNLITIRRGNSVLFSINNLGHIDINVPAGQSAITANAEIRANGLTSTGTITSDGEITSNGGITTTGLTASGEIAANGGITTANLTSNGNVRINGVGANRVFTVYNGAATEPSAWIAADGTSSFGGFPTGMISFFNRPCSAIDGWSDVPADWKGRYPRIVGAYNICDRSGENTTTGVCNGGATAANIAYNRYYGDAIREITGTVVSLTALGASITGVFENTGATGGNLGGGGYYPGDIIRFRASSSVPTATENRVKSVGLYMCVKD